MIVEEKSMSTRCNENRKTPKKRIHLDVSALFTRVNETQKRSCFIRASANKLREDGKSLNSIWSLRHEKSHELI